MVLEDLGENPPPDPNKGTLAWKSCLQMAGISFQVRDCKIQRQKKGVSWVQTG